MMCIIVCVCAVQVVSGRSPVGGKFKMLVTGAQKRGLAVLGQVLILHSSATIDHKAHTTADTNFASASAS